MNKEEAYKKCLKVLKKLDTRKIHFSENDYKVLKYLQFIQTKAKSLEAPEPTPFELSTMSAACKLKVSLNREKLCKVFDCEIKKSIINKDNDYPIKTVIYNEINVTSLTKTKKKEGSFNNQATIVVDVYGNLVNVKYFTNGSISMTGCKAEKNGLEAVRTIIREAKKYPFIFEDKKDLDIPVDYSVYDYKITLVNCDYSIGFNIDRNSLYKILLKEYGIFASFAPDFYHATKIGFMWNKATKTYQDGVCTCVIDCSCGKENDKCKCRLKCIGEDKEKKMTSTDLGYKARCCKKITMAVFENGKVIITGSHNLEQTDDTYCHMNKIFKEQYKNIVKYSVNDFEKYIPTDKRNLKIMDYIGKSSSKTEDSTVKKSFVIKRSKIKGKNKPKKKSVSNKSTNPKSNKKIIVIKNKTNKVKNITKK